ncbi:uncharacterized protein N7506_001241 [Penicillium brevicompactum]|uniref:uncharacterized protein n=1 Tax=Penicillium brevicompactum TaxID=5074 RepID=UPI002542057B|nr:uncharacterized protein N7506_001241 [Penicillium brevicompactum]KAJ5347988.1 hypothetical protein N7506_001241 [Penicillium brevicompactum]
MSHAEIWEQVRELYGGADISILQRPYHLAVPCWVFINDRITMHTSLVIQMFISENHLLWSLCAGLANSHEDPEWTDMFNLYYRAEWERIEAAVAMFPGPERFLLPISPPPLAWAIFRYVGPDRFNVFEDADEIEVRASPANVRHNADLLTLLEYIHSDRYLSAMEVDEDDHGVSPIWDNETPGGFAPMPMPIAVGGLQGTNGNPPDYEEVADHYGPNQNIDYDRLSSPPPEYNGRRSFRSEYDPIPIPGAPPRYYGGRNTYRAPSSVSSVSAPSDVQESSDAELDVAGEDQSGFDGEPQGSMNDSSSYSSGTGSPAQRSSVSASPHGSGTESPAQRSSVSASPHGSETGSPVQTESPADSSSSGSSPESGVFQMDESPERQQTASGVSSWFPKLPFQRS